MVPNPDVVAAGRRMDTVHLDLDTVPNVSLGKVEAEPGPPEGMHPEAAVELMHAARRGNVFACSITNTSNTMFDDECSLFA